MFRLIKILNGRINQGEPVRLPSKAKEKYTYGEALVLADGVLTKCGETVMPTHICAEDYEAPENGNRDIVAEPVSSEMIFEAPLSASPSSDLVVGSLVKLHTDGLQVTADTTDGGVAKIFNLNGAKETGDTVLVRF